MMVAFVAKTATSWDGDWSISVPRVFENLAIGSVQVPHSETCKLCPSTGIQWFNCFGGIPFNKRLRLAESNLG